MNDDTIFHSLFEAMKNEEMQSYDKIFKEDPACFER